MAKNAIHKPLLYFWARLRFKYAYFPQYVARWTAAIAYTVLALGIPLPMPVGKASKEAYPCMNHHCGCQTAEQCWRNCCCMTLEERLIWARENHVRPPDYALAEARVKGIQWAMYWPDERKECVANLDSCKPSHACQCCACEHCASKSACCERQHASGVVLIEALKCHGVGENWQGLAISLPPPMAVRYYFPDDCVDHVRLYSPQRSSVAYPPDVPPPRYLVAVSCFVGRHEPVGRSAHGRIN